MIERISNKAYLNIFSAKCTCHHEQMFYWWIQGFILAIEACTETNTKLQTSPRSEWGPVDEALGIVWVSYHTLPERCAIKCILSGIKSIQKCKLISPFGRLRQVKDDSENYGSICLEIESTNPTFDWWPGTILLRVISWACAAWCVPSCYWLSWEISTCKHISSEINSSIPFLIN